MLSALLKDSAAMDECIDHPHYSYWFRIQTGKRPIPPCLTLRPQLPSCVVWRMYLIGGHSFWIKQSNENNLPEKSWLQKQMMTYMLNFLETGVGLEDSFMPILFLHCIRINESPPGLKFQIKELRHYLLIGKGGLLPQSLKALVMPCLCCWAISVIFM